MAASALKQTARKRDRLRGRAGGGRGGAAHAPADTIDRKFSLGEEEDVGSPVAGRAPGVSQPRNRSSTGA